MRNLMLILITCFFLGCGTSKTVRDTKKVIKGAWTLETITYDKTGTYNTILLNDASKSCFEGSSWQFVPNNHTGVYTINKDTCTHGERYFVFTIDEIDSETGLYDFLLKPTNNKYKSETNQGFRLRLKNISETNMQWEQTVTVDGEPFKINMNFSKN